MAAFMMGAVEEPEEGMGRKMMFRTGLEKIKKLSSKKVRKSAFKRLLKDLKETKGRV